MDGFYDGFLCGYMGSRSLGLGLKGLEFITAEGFDSDFGVRTTGYKVATDAFRHLIHHSVLLNMIFDDHRPEMECRLATP